MSRRFWAIRMFAPAGWSAASTIPAWANSRRWACPTSSSAGTTPRWDGRRRPASTRRRSWRSSMPATLELTMEGGIATITLNRPDARNALNLAMCEALVAAAKAITDDEMKAVFVRGAGPVFCAGADLKERQGMSQAQVRERRLKGFAAYAALEALPMPAIAVVQGPVVGSGCEIAGACDFIVATPEASFRTPEAL